MKILIKIQIYIKKRINDIDNKYCLMKYGYKIASQIDCTMLDTSIWTLSCEQLVGIYKNAYKYYTTYTRRVSTNLESYK